MKTKIFIASFLFFPLMLFSFDMILTGDPIIDDIRFISLETGKPFLSFSPPLAPAEVQIFVQRFIDLIDEQTLSHPARQAFYRVQKRLSPVSRISYSDDIFSLLMDINAAFEGKARFNSNISWYPRYPEITPFIALPLRISFADTVQIYVEPILAINRRAHLRGNATINIPFDYADVSHNLALRAFAAAGGNWWNFQIGRDRLYWGTGRTGSLTFSDNSQYFDFARISFFSSRVKYSMTINQLPLRLRRDLFEEGRFQPEWWQDQNNTNLVLNRYYYLHRLDIRLSNRLTIGLMEGIMTGNSQLQIRYLTPMVFHDLFAWNDYPRWEGKGDMVGSIASIELNWHITNNLASYAQFVMNEFTLPGETDGHPNALGFMAGIQYTRSFNYWGALFFLEFIYTDPYLNILSSPFASFIQMDRQGNYYFIGYPRDTIALSAGGDFFSNMFNFSASFSWIASGYHNRDGIIWNWGNQPENQNARTPTGTAEHRFILSLGAGWKPNDFLSLRANLAGILSLNNGHKPGETALGGQARLSVGFRY